MTDTDALANRIKGTNFDALITPLRKKQQRLEAYRTWSDNLRKELVAVFSANMGDGFSLTLHDYPSIATDYNIKIEGLVSIMVKTGPEYNKIRLYANDLMDLALTSNGLTIIITGTGEHGGIMNQSAGGYYQAKSDRELAHHVLQDVVSYLKNLIEGKED